jgi:hypothetical protein
MINIEFLQQFEMNQMQDILAKGDFKSALIDYETPHVHRMWTQLNDTQRLFLHKIFPCDQPYMHPHPWASVIHVIDGHDKSGFYEMAVGYGDPLKPQPEGEIMRLLFEGGGYYEMLQPNGWHSVKPLHGPVYSVMITERTDWVVLNDKKPETPLEQLSFQQQKELLGFFNWHYQDRPF